jgi:hypothetical protein
MFIPPYVISGNLTYRVLLERRKKERKKERNGKTFLQTSRQVLRSW